MKEELLLPRKEPLIDLRVKTNIPAYELDAVIEGTGIINKKMVDRFAEYFHNTPEFWMNQQKQYDADNKKLQEGANI